MNTDGTAFTSGQLDSGHIDGNPAVLLRDLFGNIVYSAQDWPAKISFGGAANPWDTNFYQNCKISVIVTGSLSGYKPKFSFHLYPYKLGE